MRGLLTVGYSLVALTAAVRSAHPEPSPRVLSLVDVIKLALAQSPEIRASAFSVDSARYRLSSIRSERLPTLTADADLRVWDRPIVFAVPQPDGTVNTTTLRDRVTSVSQLTLRLPLTGQLATAARIDQARAGLKAREADHEAVRLEAAFRAALAYFELLHAEASAVVADEEVDQVTGQLEVARALEKAGVLERVDSMRLESALAGARSRAVRARAAVTIGRGQLVFALGLPPATAVEGTDNFPKSLRPAAESVDALIAKAAQRRPELIAARYRVEEARSAARVERTRSLPEISAIANYQHMEGAGALTPKNAGSIGLLLHWDVWTWGRDRNRHREAQAVAARDAVAAARQIETAGLLVRIAAQEAEAAYEQLAVLDVGLAAAEEAFRIQNARFSQGVVTTTDVLEVRIELTRARLEHARARYSYLQALVGVARVVGNPPDSFLSHL